MEEIWKDIPKYEKLYQVSNYGRVKSLKRVVSCNCRNQYKTFKISYTKKEKILKGRKDKDGYLEVNLCKNGKHSNYKIHRLVALLFINNTNNYDQVNHKDENKLNNNVNNLEWCNAKYNCNYGTRINRIKEIKNGKRGI